MQNVDDMIIKTDVIELINKKAMEKSLQQRKKEVHGECYVSRNKKRKRKIEEAKKIFLTSAALIIFVGGLGLAGNDEYAHEIRQEANSTYVKQNLIGGQYETVNRYNEGFIDYVNDLNNFELIELYDDTKDTMDSNEKPSMAEVVDEMEDNYLEEKGRGM